MLAERAHTIDEVYRGGDNWQMPLLDRPQVEQLCKLFHLGSCFFNSSCEGLVDSCRLLSCMDPCTFLEYTVLYCLEHLSIFQDNSMYVKAHLDLSLKSLVFSLVVASGPVHLGAWPGGSVKSRSALFTVQA